MAWPISRHTALAWLLLSTLISFANSLTISYCSSLNTGAVGPFYWQFQSNGHCQDTCKYQYAFGILQGNNCWCSNYAPYEQEDNGRCNVNCPGFPSEQCGNQDEGLYGYYQLDITPSGTQGAPSPTQSPDPTLPGATTVTATVLATVTNSRISTTSVFTSSSPASSPSTTLTTSNIPPPTTSTFKPTPVTIVTTVQGSIQTVTVTPTQPSSAADTSPPTTPAPADSFWSSTGKVAGTFTVVALVIVAILVALGVFFWKRRRSSDSVAIRSVSDHDGHSTTGKFFGGTAEKRHSKLGLNTAGIGNRGDSHERTPTLATPVSMSRRASHPLVHDQRLNPNALYAMGQDNGSHISVGSFQDDRDYSRPVLHVRNPDS